MVEEDDLEDDDDDVDFNPFLRLSPPVGGDSGEASDDVDEEEEEEQEGVEEGALNDFSIEGQEEGELDAEFDEEDVFLELPSEDDEEEEEFEEEEEEEEDREQEEVEDDRAEPAEPKQREEVDGEICGFVEQSAITGVGIHDPQDDIEGNLDEKIRKGAQLDRNGDDLGCVSWATSGSRDFIENGSSENPRCRLTEALADLRSPNIGNQTRDSHGMVNTGVEDEDLGDTISKRTRAHYSLENMSLDRLEMFLQETDEEDYFQNVDDEEEYRKFLLAVQEKSEERDDEDGKEKRKEDEDDEDEDADFEFEIEEALESDGDEVPLEVTKSKRRRPETREKRRQRAKLHNRGTLFGQVKLPLRPLLPYTGNLPQRGVTMEKKKMLPGIAGRCWSQGTRKRPPPVNGFTAHQIGQLYCLIHEHVQLLIQVFSLCILDPARQQVAVDSHRLLMELVEKRETILSWKKTAFPDFCFGPPYIHASIVEGGSSVPFLSSLPPNFTPPSASSKSFAACNAFGNQNLSHETTSTSLPKLQSSQQTMPSIPPSLTCRYQYNPSSSGSFSSCVNLGESENSIEFVGRTANFVSLSQPSVSLSCMSSVEPSTLQETLTQMPLQPHHLPVQTWTAPLSTVSAQMAISPDPLLVGEYPLNCASSSVVTTDAKSQPGHHATTSTPDFSKTLTTHAISHSQGGFLPVDALKDGKFQLAHIVHSSSADVPSVGVTSVYSSSATSPLQEVNVEWVPATSGPVRSLLDVAPLAIVRGFLADISHVVQDCRQRHIDNGASQSLCERAPLFVVATTIREEALASTRHQWASKPSINGLGGISHVHPLLPQAKKTMAAALVESTKQSVALVPKDVAQAVQQFLPLFNRALFPHKPPPAATANRLLFTDAEDELLAMGLMMYNTDWSAIQQRFLPSKSMHQIFVRQKNRSSSRAPENSIKAVRRMKSSPLTSAEKASIQEALSIFKYDWAKVWQYCVPYRDPAVLPRQWRIAQGTQKSYKTSDSSKERRRLYEANRRQTLAAKHDCSKTSQAVVGVCPSFIMDQSEAEGNSGGDDDGDDPEGGCIREAFLAERSPSSAKFMVKSAIPGADGLGLTMNWTSSRKRQARAESSDPQASLLVSSIPLLTFPRGTPSIYVPGSAQTTNQIKKQTVKLAPGLPSVKLPPHVKVLSQSQAQNLQPFAQPTRWIPPVSQVPWGAGVGGGRVQVSNSSPSATLPLVVHVGSEREGTQQEGLQELLSQQQLKTYMGGTCKRKPLLSNKRVSSRADKSHIFSRDICTVKNQINFTKNQAEIMNDEVSCPLSLTSTVGYQPVATVNESLVYSNVNNESSQVSLYDGHAISSSKAQDPKVWVSRATKVGKLPSILKIIQTRTRRREKVTAVSQVQQYPVAVPVITNSTQGTLKEGTLISSSDSCVTDNILNCRNSQYSTTQDPPPLISRLLVNTTTCGVQSILPQNCAVEILVQEKLKKANCFSYYSEGEYTANVVEKLQLDLSEQPRGRKKERCRTKSTIKPVNREKSADDGVFTDSPKDYHAKATCPQVNSVPMTDAGSTIHHRARKAQQVRNECILPKSRKKKYQRDKGEIVRIDDEVAQLGSSVIVMEQEELSDSEEEFAADVHFECEEMGDSDRDSLGKEPEPAEHSKDCEIEFEEEEISSDKEKDDSDGRIGGSDGRLIIPEESPDVYVVQGNKQNNRVLSTCLFQGPPRQKKLLLRGTNMARGRGSRRIDVEKRKVVVEQSGDYPVFITPAYGGQQNDIGSHVKDPASPASCLNRSEIYASMCSNLGKTSNPGHVENITQLPVGIDKHIAAFKKSRDGDFDATSLDAVQELAVFCQDPVNL